jgi:photosystem II stability/assembly factor-like uncharacterized protein
VGATTAAAAVNRWSSHGPFGGEITALAIAPANTNSLYAGSRGGALFRSVDGGQQWHRAGRGLPAVKIDRIVVSPLNSNRLWVGTRLGVYRSGDGGESFLPRLDSPLLDFAVAPSDPTILYAGSDDYTGSHSVLRSNDAGISWTPRVAGIPSSILTVGVDAYHPETVYAGSSVSSPNFRSLFKSDDGGQTWQSMPSPDALLYPAGVSRIVTHPAISDLLYVATYQSVFRSADGGRTWTRTAIASWENAIAMDPRNDRRVWTGGALGLFRSDDSGATLVQMPVKETVNTIAIDPRTPDTMYVGTDRKGVLRSDDAGATWREVNAGLAATTITSFAADPHDTKVVYAGTSTGQIFRTDDGGDRWEGPFALPVDGYTTSVVALAADPSDSSIVYAINAREILRSLDHGVTWTSLHVFDDVSPGTNSLSSIAVDPSTPKTLYVVAIGDDFSYLPGSVRRSTDGGVTWNEVKLDGCPPTYGFFLGPFAVDPKHPSTLYLGTNYKACRSDDAGLHWITLNDRGLDGTVRSFHIDPEHRTIYAGTDFYGVFRSSDDGDSWTRLNQGLPSLEQLSVQAIGGAGPDLYMAVANRLYPPTALPQSLFRTTDGQHWLPSTVGIEHPGVLALLTSGRTTYAGTLGTGVLTFDRVPLSITSISPDAGAPEGGSRITIKGTGFDEAATVTVGGLPTGDVTFVDSATLVVTTPSNLPCTAEVSAQNPDGEVAYLRDAFRYADAAAPKARLAGTPTICAGDSTDLSVALDGTAPFTIEWSDGFVQSDLAGPVATRTVSPGATTFYAVRRVRDAVCANGGEGSALVTVNPSVGTIAIQASDTLSAGGNFIASTRFLPGGEYEWSIENGEIETNSGSTIYGRVGQAGTMTLSVRLTNPQGCSSQLAQKTMSVIPSSSTRVIPALLGEVRPEGRVNTELVLTNVGNTRADVDLTYTAASVLGAIGNGTAHETLEPGEQKIIRDALAYLRGQGIAIPAATASNPQGGSLVIDFHNLSSPIAGIATARRLLVDRVRTSGFSYPAFSPTNNNAITAIGLRETENETSDLELVNLSATDTLTATLVIHDGNGRSQDVLRDVTLGPWQWTRLPALMTQTGFGQGTVTLQSISPGSAYGQVRLYAVIHDLASGDASYLAQQEGFSGSEVVPLVVESPTEETELILSNVSPSYNPTKLCTLVFTPDDGGDQQSVTMDTPVGAQLIIPSIIDFLRSHGATIPPRGETIRGTIRTTKNDYLIAAARTLRDHTGVAEPSASSAYREAFVTGLREDRRHHTTVGIVNPGLVAVTLQWELFDGATGQQAASSDPFVLGPGEARRIDTILADANVAAGYLHVTKRLDGVASVFYVYAIINDLDAGGATADSSFLTMTPFR